MEGYGERTDPIPAEPRRKVLRAGVRIVAEQFAPYSDEPSEIDLIFDFSKIAAGVISANKITWSSPAPSTHQVLQDLHTAMAKIDVEANSFKPASGHMIQVMKHMVSVFDEIAPEPPPKQDGLLRDRRPKKNKKQTEPFYVKLVKPRRRR